MKKNKRDLPHGVPEENVYEKTHWLMIVAFLVATVAVYLLITNAGQHWPDDRKNNRERALSKANPWLRAEIQSQLPRLPADTYSHG